MTSEEKKLLMKIFEKVIELPKREEPISGQMFKYVKLEDVVEILQEIELLDA